MTAVKRSRSSRTGTAKWLRLAKEAKTRAQHDGQFTCPLCGVALDYTRSRQPNSPEADHVVPYSQGGEDVIENIRIICRLCNQKLGGKLGASMSRVSRASDRVVSRSFRTVGDW